MKELLRFSLKRRFFNKTQIFINLLIFTVSGCVLFADHLIQLFVPDLLEPTSITTTDLPKEMINTLNETNHQFIFHASKKPLKTLRKTKELVLAYDGEYTLYSNYPIDDVKRLTLESMINSYMKQQIIDENPQSEALFAYIKPFQLKTKALHKQKQDEKEGIVFLIVTGIYFMMLSFATTVANEVVYEKSTKTLELILTSVDAKTHFLSKLFTGWLTILFQCVITGGCFLFWFLIRYQIDDGAPLLEAAKTLQLITFSEPTFSALISQFALSFDFILLLCGVFLFLLIGMLLIQMVLVVISSFISSIEAASSIQAPFYFILIAVYYLTLSLNNPQQMSQGLGYYLSYLPFFSMLMMPCRLMLTTVTVPEFLLALFFSIMSLLAILRYGGAIYQKGVLDYSNKGLIQILKTIVSKT